MSKGKSKTGLYAAIAIIVIIIVVVGVVVALMYKPGGTGTPLTMYAGEVSTAAYGFGNSANSIATAPNGPTLTLKEGTSYTMTVTNSGTMPHAWEITRDKTYKYSALGSPNRPNKLHFAGSFWISYFYTH